MFADLQSELPFQGRDDSLLAGAHGLLMPEWLIPGVREDDEVATLSGLPVTLVWNLGSLQQ